MHYSFGSNASEGFIGLAERSIREKGQESRNRKQN